MEQNRRVLTINITDLRDVNYVRLLEIPVYSVQENVTSTAAPDGIYDGVGALKFIVCTVVVYSVFGVFCTLLNRVKGKGKKYNHQDEETGRYLKKERSLKLEGYKMTMLSEIRKYDDSIRRFEEKMRLIALKREIEETAELGSRYRKEKKRRFSLGFLPKRSTSQPSHAQRRKLSLTDSAVSKMAASFLFLQTKNASQNASARTLDVVTEDETAFVNSANSASMSCVDVTTATLPRSLTEPRLNAVSGDQHIEPSREHNITITVARAEDTDETNGDIVDATVSLLQTGLQKSTITDKYMDTR